MSERLFRLNTTELISIRIACQKLGCGSSTELSLQRLEIGGHPKCVVCGEQFFTEGEFDLQNFAVSVRAMNALKSKVKFEFTIPILDEKN